MHIAAANGKLITLCYLLDAGANPFLYDSLEKLPVHYALEEDHDTVVAELLTKMYEKSKYLPIEIQIKTNNFETVLPKVFPWIFYIIKINLD